MSSLSRSRAAMENASVQRLPSSHTHTYILASACMHTSLPPYVHTYIHTFIHSHLLAHIGHAHTYHPTFTRPLYRTLPMRLQKHSRISMSIYANNSEHLFTSLARFVCSCCHFYHVNSGDNVCALHPRGRALGDRPVVRLCGGVLHIVRKR